MPLPLATSCRYLSLEIDKILSLISFFEKHTRLRHLYQRFEQRRHPPSDSFSIHAQYPAGAWGRVTIRSTEEPSLTHIIAKSLVQSLATMFLCGNFIVAFGASLLFTTTTHALTITYCSSQNTGSSFAAGMFRLVSCLVYHGANSVVVDAQFQSDGACQQTCLGSYAFAILQGSDCWCSNYIPAETVPPSSCNEQCPGFPNDTCGNSAEGLFGYIALTISPSGTLGVPDYTAAPSSFGPQPVSSYPSAPSSTLPIPISIRISTIFESFSYPETQTSIIPVSSLDMSRSLTSSVLTFSLTDYCGSRKCCDRAGNGDGLVSGTGCNNFLSTAPSDILHNLPS